MSQAEVDEIFPLLKPQMEGNIPIEEFDEADMIVVGDPDRVLEKMKRYCDIGVDPADLLQPVRLPAPRRDHAIDRVVRDRSDPEARTLSLRARSVAVPR